MFQLILAAGLLLATSPPPDPAELRSDSPENALKVLERGYNTRSLHDLGSLYTANYQFHFPNQEKTVELQAFGREKELSSANHLFHGLVVDGKTVLVAADNIAMSIAGLTANPDPEHPDSTDHYRLIASTQCGLAMTVPGTNTLTRTFEGLSVFQLVRGDAAVLAKGQVADPTLWYIRGWFEDLDGLSSELGKQKGDCDPGALPATSPLALGIRPLGNPACPTIDLACDVPAAGNMVVEVFDVAGRRINQRTIEVKQPGVQRIQAGSGVTIRPGAYWVRLTQANLRTTRMIAVAK